MRCDICKSGDKLSKVWSSSASVRVSKIHKQKKQASGYCRVELRGREILKHLPPFCGQAFAMKMENFGAVREEHVEDAKDAASLF